MAEEAQRTEATFEEMTKPRDPPPGFTKYKVLHQFVKGSGGTGFPDQEILLSDEEAEVYLEKGVVEKI